MKYNIHSYLFIYLGCNDDELPWGKENEDKSKTKYMYVCHAEMNAIMNKNSSTVESCTMYVALFPCNEVIHFGKEPSINDLTNFVFKVIISHGSEVINEWSLILNLLHLKYFQYFQLSPIKANPNIGSYDT